MPEWLSAPLGHAAEPVFVTLQPLSTFRQQEFLHDVGFDGGLRNLDDLIAFPSTFFWPRGARKAIHVDAALGDHDLRGALASRSLPSRPA